MRPPHHCAMVCTPVSDRNAPRRLDIEGAEFSVIPRLLVSGVLCRVDFMLVEWHLHRVVRSKLMHGFALRHAFDSQLRQGCTEPPEMVDHDDYFENNFGIDVPGLIELAKKHRGEGLPPALRETIQRKAAPDEDAGPATLTSPHAARRAEVATGYCAVTMADWAGSCSHGRLGSWGLTASESRGGWRIAASACMGRCLSCAQCRYVSVSLQHSDCSWFSSCNLTRLHQKPSGFRSYSVPKDS